MAIAHPLRAITGVPKMPNTPNVNPKNPIITSDIAITLNVIVIGFNSKSSRAMPNK